ncbi:MAG: DEAD/DEAH box helicase [Brasilonema angustatum HA4187-MV1]|jgi:superfamily II DNA or RNA helicase|nr:DEAD/DEAH box helicase [Brasilonema angustatum HA4187-MV1]
MKLRKYQKKIIADTYRFLKMGLKSILVYAPTGAGKTVMASQMIADAVNKGRCVLFLVHRTKLAFQTVNTLKSAYGIDAGIIWADYPKTPDAPVQIAMIQTLQNRDLPEDIKFVVLDECHTTAYYKIVQKVFDTYSGGILPLSPCYFVGLSGSPWRSKSKEGFCQFFQAVVQAPGTEELIRMGHLVTARHFGWNGLADFSQLDFGSNGDFTEKSMQKVCDAKLNAEIVNRFLEHCPDRKPIAFCASVLQAYDLSKQFNDAGIVAETVVGEIPEDSRDPIYERFKLGKTQLMSSVGCLTEGFDETSCDAVILARPVGSLPLLTQMCGRALRLHEGKSDAMLLDFCENFKRQGLITKSHPISLCPKNKPSFTPTKECPQCHASVPVFAKICPECGYEFSGEEESLDPPSYADVAFGELLSEEQKEQCTYLRSQLQRAYKKERDIGRVSFLFHRKFNFMPPEHWYEDAIFRRGKHAHEQQRKADIEVFKKYLKQSRLGAPKPWLLDMLRREFGRRYFDINPVRWWDILSVEVGCDWETIKSAYVEKISDVQDQEAAALLNFCLEEAREFAAIMNIKIA